MRGTKVPRKAKELSALEVRRLIQPGRWSVGGSDGLALQVTPSGARTWVLRVRVGGRQRELGLGGFPTVGLAEARERARVERAKVLQGVDPRLERDRARRTMAEARHSQQDFATVAEQYIALHAKSWKNRKHAMQWTATLQAYAYPVIGVLPPSEITVAHVVSVLEPIWITKTETASRVRSRIELVLDFAGAKGWREGLNPARWRGNLDAALPRPSKVSKVVHHPAVAVGAVAGFMARLRQQPGIAARALELLVLTAARSAEVRGAVWSEFDLEAGLWVLPAARMKADREHRVPLSEPARVLLAGLAEAGGQELVFPGLRGPLSDMSLLAVLRRMKVTATAHGFRSTFRDWAADKTHYPGEVVEMALAHAVGDKVEAAYRRGDLYEKRVLLMRDWAAFLDGRAGGR